jgi:N-methylhydantoinase B/oxoprolinase/acetone carboxylase alpha subunit
MASFVLTHRKCESCGRILFPSQQEILTIEGRSFCNAVCRNLSARDIGPAELPAIFGLPDRRLDDLIDDRADPITLEVVQGALASACAEMGTTMIRTALSLIFYDGHDFTCALFDSGIELIAQYEGAPAQLGAMKYAVAWAVQEIGRENIEPGDVIIHNDSYRGTPHLPEFCMILPIFFEGQLVAFAAIIAHHPDVGGKAPGSMPGDATEIFQEGLIVPPVKLFRRGEQASEIWRIILANIRNSELSEGDLMAMHGSLVVGNERVTELLRRYGIEAFVRYVEESKNRSEYRMRKEIRSIPDGVYFGEGIVDDDGVDPGPFYIRVAVIVKDTRVIVDFRGSDPQTKGPVNAPYGVTVSATINAISHLVDPTIPHNEGVFRPVAFIVPPGTVVNVNYPGALNGGNTETHNIIVRAVMRAFASAIPQRVQADECGTCTYLTGGGRGEGGKPVILVAWEPGGWGGRWDKDGNTAMITFCGTVSTNLATEVLESALPVRVARYELSQDSGGAGKYRGGLGVTREYELLCPMELSIHSNRHDFPPEGIFGGGPGGPSSFRFSRDGRMLEAPAYSPQARSFTKASGIICARGQHVAVGSPGGGGYGRVEDRPRNKIIEDLKNELISLDSAVETYNLPRDEAERIADQFWYKRFLD